MFDHDYIYDYLCRCGELTRFCSQNGWIDRDSIVYRVLERHEESVLVAVEFTEVIDESAEAGADRVPCFGQVKLEFDPSGKLRAQAIC